MGRVARWTADLSFPLSCLGRGLFLLELHITKFRCFSFLFFLCLFLFSLNISDFISLLMLDSAGVNISNEAIISSLYTPLHDFFFNHPKLVLKFEPICARLLPLFGEVNINFPPDIHS